MKNGDIFYTFDEQTELVKRMVFIEMRSDIHVYAVEITGTTTFSNIWFHKNRVFKTPEEAFEALKRFMKHQYETRLRFVEEQFKRMYKNEVLK